MRSLLIAAIFVSGTCAPRAEDITLTDGRVFKDASISPAADGRVIVSGKDAAGIDYAASVPADLLPRGLVGKSATLQDVPTGDSLYIKEIDLRPTDSRGAYTYYSWLAKVGNPTGRGRVVVARIVFLDKKGFQIDEAFSEEVGIPPGAFEVISGASLMKSDLWSEVDSYRVVIK